MKIGDKVFVHGYVDEIRKDIIIIRNEGGYFGTVPDEILPSAQPNHNAEPGKMEIIHCKDCKHWNLQVGNVKGDGLGSCDFHNVNLVTGEGFCYWADRRGEAE